MRFRASESSSVDKFNLHQFGYGSARPRFDSAFPECMVNYVTRHNRSDGSGTLRRRNERVRRKALIDHQHGYRAEALRVLVNGLDRGGDYGSPPATFPKRCRG